ncbi:MAG: mechanosensitive ion channel family protein [Candidatus Micrarchaeota archaeon]|nr:mechanosensitive ion channel family protein [Candidatus Micrarchaeota archaeon]
MSYSQILQLEIFGNTVYDYLIAIGVFVVTWITIFIVKKIILNQLKEITKRTKTTIDDKMIEYVNSISVIFYVVFSIYISTLFLKLPDIVNKIITYSLIITLAYYIVKFVHKVIEHLFGKIEAEQAKKYNETDFSQLHLMRDIVKAVVWLIAALLFLSNLGFDVTALIAGLGIGGIAVAFALQNVLSDIFASFSIYFDKPFKKGDYIVVGNERGTIKKIGLKTTRIESVEGDEVIVANKMLVDSVIHNYKKMNFRRATFTFGVEYNTPIKKLEKIPQIIKEIIESKKYENKNITKVERVFFKSFGDSALIYEVQYTIFSNDYNVYAAIQNEINIEILKRFNKEKIRMAYPTRTVYLKKVNEKGE